MRLRNRFKGLELGLELGVRVRVRVRELYLLLCLFQQEATSRIFTQEAAKPFILLVVFVLCLSLAFVFRLCLVYACGFGLWSVASLTFGLWSLRFSLRSVLDLG
jgi:hypothetical protein